MEYKGELARRVPGQWLSLLLYSPAHDKLNPCPGTRRATFVGLIADMKWALVYRSLAWHGTMLAVFNL